MTEQPPDQAPTDEVTRRGLLKWAIGWLTAAIVALSAWPLVGSLIGPMYRRAAKRYTDLGAIDLIPEGVPTRLTYREPTESAYIYMAQQHDVWVVRHGDQVIVYSPICPHLACRYSWFPRAGQFVCPCHGSVFSITGKVLAGPAPRPLDTLKHKIVDGRLWILWERFEPGVKQKIVIG